MSSAEERHARVAQRFEKVDRNLTVVEEKLADIERTATAAAALPWWRCMSRRRAIRAGRRLLAETRALLDVNARMQAGNEADLAAVSTEMRSTP
jgi:hypothetical protein